MRAAAGLWPAVSYAIQHNAGLRGRRCCVYTPCVTVNDVEFKRTQLANRSEGIAPAICGLSQGQHRPAAIRYEGEEGATGKEGAMMACGRCVVTLH